MARRARPAIYLDPAEAAAAQRARRHKFHTEDVPRLRLIGFAFNAVGVIVHNWLVFDLLGWRDAAQHSAILLGYAVFAWMALASF